MDFRRPTLGLIVCFCFAWCLARPCAAALREAAPPEVEVPIRYSYFLIRSAVEARDFNRAAGLFDYDKMLDQLVATGLIRPLDKDGRAAFIRSARGELSAADFVLWKILGSRSLEVRSIWLTDDPDEVVVYTVGVSNGEQEQYRWFWTRRDGVWRLVDYDAVGWYLSWSMTWAIESGRLVGEKVIADMKLWRQATRLGEVYESMDSQDPEAWAEQFDGLPATMPAPFDVPHAMAHAVLNIYQDDTQVERWLDVVEAAGDDSCALLYMRANAALLAGRYQEAIRLAEDYDRRLGPDPDLAETWSDALVGLGRHDEAVAVLKRALDDFGNSYDAVLALALLTADQDAAELLPYFAGLEPLPTYFEALADDLVDEEKYTALTQLTKLYAANHPDRPFVAYYQALLEYRDKHYPQAIERLAAAQPKLTTDDHRKWASKLLVKALYQDGRPLEAYRRAWDRQDALFYLGGKLFDDGKPQTLEKLLALRTADDPNDIWLYYYRGHALYLVDRDEDAVVSYFLGYLQARNDENREFFRYGAVRSMIYLGRGLEAYRDVPPAEETFAQVAEAGLLLESTDELRRLLDVRRRDAPADAGLHYFTARADYKDKRWEQVVQTLSVHREAILADDSRQQRFEYQLIFALLHLGRIEEAHQYALESTERDGDPYFLVYTHAQAGRTPQAIDAAVQCHKQWDYGLETFYGHETLGPLIQHADWAGFRLDYPRPENAEGAADSAGG